jgi:ATP phosphoribosyltransferase
MLKLVLPKGSLEKATFELFEDADLAVKRTSSIDYKGEINDPRIGSVRILRPQEIPKYVEQELFDIGITGYDWVCESQAKVEVIGPLTYSKNTDNPIRLVLAVSQDNPANRPEELAKSLRVSTEYPNIAKAYFEKFLIKADIMLSYGATEAKVPDIADAVIEITETGSALRAAKLKIIDEVLISQTQLIASPSAVKDPDKKHAIDQIYTLLLGALDARTKVLVKLNVTDNDLEAVLRRLPALKSPTVSKLYVEGQYAIETVVLKQEINTLIPELKDLGASDILEIPLSKIVR